MGTILDMGFLVVAVVVDLDVEGVAPMVDVVEAVVAEETTTNHHCAQPVP